MTLDPTTKSALRERLIFYRELGIGRFVDSDGNAWFTQVFGTPE